MRQQTNDLNNTALLITGGTLLVHSTPDAFVTRSAWSALTIVVYSEPVLRLELA